MKRRLFLKTSSLGIGGAVALPTVVYGCSLFKPMSLNPSLGLELFQSGSVLFDSSIAELRLAGSGRLASAEAEDVDLAGILQQIVNGQAEAPAELAEDFTESSTDMLNASSELAESSSEVFPLNQGQSAELADDFALLKVVKASTLLAGAAKVTPAPIRKVAAANKMVASAELVHEAVNASSEAELIESTGELLAHSEEYVGAAETYSAEVGFVAGVDNYAESAEFYAENDQFSGAETLLASTDNISLAASYFGDGVDNLNAEAEFFNSPELVMAAEMVPSSELLVAEANLFTQIAQGESAEMGASEMLKGASEILSDAETNAPNIGNGGDALDLGADQFIAGSISFVSAQSYTEQAAVYLQAAESLNGRYASKAEDKIISSTELLGPAAENFYMAAQALESIELTDGVESIVPAASELVEGAEYLQRLATNAETRIGAAEMVKGAEQAKKGAMQSANHPNKFLESGAESVEIGTFAMISGAAEFIEGYQ